MKKLSEHIFDSVKFIALAIVVGSGVSYAFAAVVPWTDAPGGTPPGNCTTGYPGCDAPVHVGSQPQTKYGPLALVSSNHPSGYLPTANTNLDVEDLAAFFGAGLVTTSFQLSTGKNYGYVLTSDSDGNGTWAAPVASKQVYLAIGKSSVSVDSTGSNCYQSNYSCSSWTDIGGSKVTASSIPAPTGTSISSPYYYLVSWRVNYNKDIGSSSVSISDVDPYVENLLVYSTDGGTTWKPANDSGTDILPTSLGGQGHAPAYSTDVRDTPILVPNAGVNFVQTDKFMATAPGTYTFKIVQRVNWTNSGYSMIIYGGEIQVSTLTL